MDANTPTDTTSVAPPRHSSTARTAWAEVALCGVLALWPYLWRLALGTRRYPNDDAWAYERIFETFHLHGEISFIDWNDITLVGMLPVTELWVRVVGYGTLQVNLLGAVMGMLSLLALRSILHAFGCARVAFVLCTFGLSMGFVATTGTYMADLFALAGSIWSFALAVKVVRRVESRDEVTDALQLYGLVLLSSLASVYAFSVRQQTLVAAGAVGLLLLLAARRARLGWLVFGVTYASLVVPFYVWRGGLEHGGEVMVSFSGPQVLMGLVIMAAMLSISLLPVVVATVGPLLHRWLPIRVLLSAGVAVVAYGIDVTQRISDHLNVASQLVHAGQVAQTIGAVVVVNILITFVGGGLRLRLPDDRLVRTTALCAVLILVADCAFVVLAANYYPRYSLFFLSLALPVLGVVGTADTPPLRAHSPTGWITLGALGLTSVWVLDHELGVAAADFDAAEVAVCAGVPHGEIDAGFVWMGAHYDGIASPTYSVEPMIEDGLPPTFHHRIFPDAERRVLVTDGGHEAGDDIVVVGTVGRSGFLPGTHARRWIVVRTEDADLFEECLAGSGDQPSARQAVSSSIAATQSAVASSP